MESLILKDINSLMNIECDHEVDLSLPLEEFSLWWLWEVKIMRHIDRWNVILLTVALSPTPIRKSRWKSWLQDIVTQVILIV